MSVFFNFFIKIFSFFAAITLFFIFIGLLLNLSSYHDKEIGQFSFQEGEIDSKNKIILLKLFGPILNQPMDLVEFNLISDFRAIYLDEFSKLLEKIKNENPKGLIISIDSPGGSVSATYSLFKKIKNFKRENNVKVYLHTNELLASGGYWFALASDKIYASYGAMIGSIGVKGPEWIYFDNPVSISSGILGQSIETTKGIKKYNTIAGTSKDLFDPFRPPTINEIQSLQEMVNEIYVDFVNSVSKERKLEINYIKEDLGALIFSAKKAKNNFLIDDVKNLEEVKKSLISNLKLKDYKIIEYERKSGLLKNFFISSLLFKYDSNLLEKNRICNLISSSINVIFLNSKNLNDC
tara:strand:- start:759 stop:1811 length:1053 start_codon:yes stop_codon:yes gene_type:complete